MSRNFYGTNKTPEERSNSGEMVQLHEIANRNSSGIFYFDGVLCCRESKRYVQRVPFTILSIGGYEDASIHTVNQSIWIQSTLGEKCGVWYCPKTPAVEYRRFYEPFLWIADFAKHLVDYMHDHRRTSLIHLRQRLCQWLLSKHGNDASFQKWFDQKKNEDFRGIATAHVSFLMNQAVQLDPLYSIHPLWNEIHPGQLNAVPRQIEFCQEVRGLPQQKTVVTPYAYKMFKHLPIARCFDVVHPQVHVTARDFNDGNTRITGFREIGEEHDVCIGDVVAVKSDIFTAWREKNELWYGYVQSIKHTKAGQKLDLIWLYRSTDTPCQDMKYPHKRELFLSDHCNCGDSPIYTHEVVSNPQVAFFAGPDFDKADFFVRQKYSGSNSTWETLKESDFSCDCGVKNLGRDYRIGDTLLVARPLQSSKRALEPVVLVEKAPRGLTKLIRVRLLKRLGRDVQNSGDILIEPNELLFTSILEEIPVTDIHRPCHIRFYSKEEKDQGRIPAPYCRQGTADCFFITHQLSSDQEHPEPLTRPWPLQFNEGWDPLRAECQPKLRGLDIFCGGGNLGRGLEEGGAVEFEHAVDNSKEAIHTYNANLKEDSKTKLIYGSVNDFLRRAMAGQGGKLVAQAGEVEVISAGSPCQGFSLANQRRGSDQSLVNISMVASVVSYLDFYRPKYAFLENVLGMAKCGVNKKENIFAQVLCALVGMGYQVRASVLDAWNFGSPQSRTRLFISITAPGLTPLSDPPQSHSHPEGIPARSLGKTANGLPLGSRYWDITPFEYVTIGEATKDLPAYDGKTDSILFPDHRPVRQVSSLNHVRISCIPRFPREMSFVKAARRGLMPPPQLKALLSVNKIRTSMTSRAWQRVNPDALLPTVKTGVSPEDGIAGSCVHWNNDRLITLMEVRRAQNFPDEEVIVGTLAKQWKIVGNSVARPVAVVLGMSLRAAWLANGLPSAISQKHDQDRFARSPSPSLNISGERSTLTLSESAQDKRIFESATPSCSTDFNEIVKLSSDSERPVCVRSDMFQTQRKLQTPITRSPTAPHETIVISSDSESDASKYLSTTIRTSTTTTGQTTSSETLITKTTASRKFKP